MSSALVVTALFNGAWQGALLCGAAFALFRCMRNVNASTMFTVWSVLLGICLALPVANYAFAAKPYVTVQRPASVSGHSPVSGPAAGVPSNARARSTATHPTAGVSTAAPQPSLRERGIDLISSILAQSRVILLGLVLVMFLRLAQLARDVSGMIVARRASTRIAPPVGAALQIERPYAFASSSTLRSPCVLGFAPALIVIPDDLLQAPQERLLGVVLHEAEHVRRYDDVQNVLHRCISALAFFCPGVHVALRELALYREQICDDAAIGRLGDPVAYAKTLTSMAQWAQGRGVPVPSFMFKRKQLVRRLEMLLDRAVNHSLSIDRRAAVSFAAALTLTALIVLRIQVPVVAQQLAPAPVIPARPVAAVSHVVPSAAHVAPAAPVARVARAAPAARVARAPLAKPVVAARVAAPRFAARAPVAPKLDTLPQRPAYPHAYEHAHAHSVRAYASRWSFSPAPALPVVAQSQAFAAPAAAMRRAIRTLASGVAYAPANAPAARPDAWGSPHADATEELLSALEAAGLRNLSVDQLVKLRDYGIHPMLIAAAHSYFGSALDVDGLVRLAEYGVGPVYLAALSSSGLRNVTPADVVRLYEYGVSASYITRIRAYNPHATVDDIIKLHNSGF